jgi:hypothetical protein
MENELAEHQQDNNELHLQMQIDLLREELSAQRTMLEDALAYATHLEEKIKSLADLSNLIRGQLADLKKTTDAIHQHASL